MLYLAYGANTHKASMAYRCPDAEFIGTARLDGYALAFRGVADVRPAHAQSVHLALWDISASDLAALDRFEGYPRLYTRQQIAFETLTMHRRVELPPNTPAWVYRMTNGYGLASPSPSYLATLREGYEDCGLPGGQLDAALEEVGAVPWGTAGYSSRQWAL